MNWCKILEFFISIIGGLMIPVILYYLKENSDKRSLINVEIYNKLFNYFELRNENIFYYGNKELEKKQLLNNLNMSAVAKMPKKEKRLLLNYLNNKYTDFYSMENSINFILHKFRGALMEGVSENYDYSEFVYSFTNNENLKNRLYEIIVENFDTDKEKLTKEVISTLNTHLLNNKSPFRGKEYTYFKNDNLYEDYKLEEDYKIKLKINKEIKEDEIKLLNLTKKKMKWLNSKK